jgi:hypothetical protein
MSPAKEAATAKTQDKYNEERRVKAFTTEGIAEVDDFYIYAYNTTTDKEVVITPDTAKADPVGVQLFDAIDERMMKGFDGYDRALLFATDAHTMLHITTLQALRAGRDVPIRYHYKPKGVWDPYHALVRAPARAYYSFAQMLDDFGILEPATANTPAESAEIITKLVQCAGLEALADEPSQFQEA